VELSKVITLWGSPNSGKTTLTIKLARRLYKNNNVIMLSTDIIAPPIGTILPYTREENKSLGKLLEMVTLTQEDILKNLITLKDNKNLTFLGYRQGEDYKTHAEYTADRANELIVNLSHLADYLIIDASSIIQSDILSKPNLLRKRSRMIMSKYLDFAEVLRRVQEHISSNYAILISGEGIENSKIKLKSYIKKYIEDHKLDVGVSLSIRIVNPRKLTKEDFIKTGTATEEMLDFLTLVHRYGESICFTGATSSGKTTPMSYIRISQKIDTLYSNKGVNQLSLRFA
jgi:GTPase SAR1 family protein